MYLAVAALPLSTAVAAPIAFEISGGSATPIGFAVGTTVSVNPSPGLASAFELDLDAASPTPASRTFDFLDISVSGEGITTGIIAATLNFSTPVLGSATGLLVGFAVLLDELATGTVEVLANPGPIGFGNGGLFGVTFQGISDTCIGCSKLSGTIKATVTLLKAPGSVPVPEPATLTLLGAGLIALALTSRRRRRA